MLQCREIEGFQFPLFGQFIVFPSNMLQEPNEVAHVPNLITGITYHCFGAIYKSGSRGKMQAIFSSLKKERENPQFHDVLASKSHNYECDDIEHVSCMHVQTSNRLNAILLKNVRAFSSILDFLPQRVKIDRTSYEYMVPFLCVLSVKIP